MNIEGMHLVATRFCYTHHGIGIINNEVIQYSGVGGDGPINIVSLEEFSEGCDIKIKDHPERKHNIKNSMTRAKSRLGEDAYSIFSNNCEHFIEWCIDGKHQSNQVDTGTTIVSGGSSVAAGAGAIGMVSSAGTVAGLSGSGIMSGLATVGGAVGGGAVAGAGVLGGVSGLGMATLMNNTVLKDDINLEEHERDSRQAGRVATYTGAAAGTAGGVVAIAAGGSAGLSAAGISSGLAAIGGTVGGGMAAGTAVVAAAPVAAAAIVGYGAYKVWQFFSD